MRVIFVAAKRNLTNPGSLNNKNPLTNTEANGQKGSKVY